MLCHLCHQNLEEAERLSHLHWGLSFYHCSRCDLIMRYPESFLDWGQQKQRYDLHQNDPQDPRYIQYFQKFLGQVQDDLRRLRQRQSLPQTGQNQVELTGIDWGCGAGPVLRQLLAPQGFRIQNYDPLYFPEKPQETVDLILSTEVFEHFLDPRQEIQEILSHLKAGGVVCGMTQFHQGKEHFHSWWYAKDPTHVHFYSAQTIQWIAQQWGLEAKTIAPNIFVLLKTPIFL